MKTPNHNCKLKGPQSPSESSEVKQWKGGLVAGDTPLTWALPTIAKWRLPGGREPVLPSLQSDLVFQEKSDIFVCCVKYFDFKTLADKRTSKHDGWETGFWDQTAWSWMSVLLTFGTHYSIWTSVFLIRKMGILTTTDFMEWFWGWNERINEEAENNPDT